DLLALTASDAELRDYLLLVGLESELYSKKKAKNFSLGMKQRLSIAFALMSNPEFIVLDEPMNGLDPVGIKNVRDLILKLNAEKGTTFLISSHILNELDKVASTYGFISHGNLIEEISAEELLKKAKGFTKIVLEESLTKESVALLEEFTYELISPTVLRVTDEKVAQKIFQTLINADVKVKEFNVERETIEDYYLQVISGGRK
ncbi:MAG TPA: ABC transporter ATP-binding protein, partial [Bacilli bacterium]|nr:ABC transporter ATP-binding protein [Bacilli bacterium]